MNNLDATDLRILELLQENAQLTTKEIGAKLQLSNTPVHERIKRLEREGYIRKYVALLNPQKLNRSLTAYCNVQLKEHSRPYLDKFEREVTCLKEVVACYYIAGTFDYLLKVMVANMEEYHEFIAYKLAALDNIGHAQSAFVMKEIMESTALPLK